MQFFVIKKRKTRFKKGGRVNPHRFWNVFVLLFIGVFTASVLAMTFFFVRSLGRIDAPVLPRLDTGIRPVEKVKRHIEKGEEAVQKRTGSSVQEEAQ